MKFSERTAGEKLMELRMARWGWSYARAERTKSANARANIVTLKKNELAILCMGSSDCRLSSAGSHPSAHDVPAQSVFLHVAASLLALAARLAA